MRDKMKDSNKLRNDVIYQVFVRQHGIHHDFSDVKADLNRIKDLGVDIIYLMPIFPVYGVLKFYIICPKLFTWSLNIDMMYFARQRKLDIELKTLLDKKRSSNKGISNGRISYI